MSRIGKKPIPVPAGVNVSVNNGEVSVKGKHGELRFEHHPAVSVAYDKDVQTIVVKRSDDRGESRALHGLTRALINNMVTGVATPFEKKLEIQGVGYQAAMSGKTLTLQVGFANAVKLPIPRERHLRAAGQHAHQFEECGQARRRAVRGQHSGRASAGTVQRQRDSLRRRARPPQGRQGVRQLIRGARFQRA